MENQHCWQLQEIGGHAKELVREFFEVHNPDLPVPIPRPRARWCPPQLGCYEANVDAAMFIDLDCTGIGLVFRDHEGYVIAAMSQRISLSQSVEMAEALAVR